MSIVPLGTLLAQVRAEGRALGSFNAVSIGYMEAIISGAELAGLPVVVALSASHLKYLDMKTFVWYLQERGGSSSVAISSQLDHANDEEVCKQALDLGFSSVMFDGKGLDYSEKVRRTRALVAWAQGYKALVEAPLDDIGKCSRPGKLTEPEAAEEFVAETGIQILAASVGTSHGLAPGQAQADVYRVREICRAVRAAVSVHGGSGIEDSAYGVLVSAGVAKISIFTRLSMASVAAVRAALAAGQPRYPELEQAARMAVAHEVYRLMGLFDGRT